MQVSMIQRNYWVNDFEGNATKIIQAIRENKTSDLIVFSELCVSGYYPYDELNFNHYVTEQWQYVYQIIDSTVAIESYVVLGVLRKNTGVGKPYYNSLIVVHKGEIVLDYDKQLLPTYNIFDEYRWFEPGKKQSAILDVNGFKLGFLICEDTWNIDGKDYDNNPVASVVTQGIDMLVTINASPSNVGKIQQRFELFKAIPEKFDIPFVYVNQVGGQDQLVFDGSSFVMDKSQYFACKSFEEDTCVFTVEKTKYATFIKNCNKAEKLVAFSDSEFFYKQIVMGLKDYIHKIGMQKVVIGSSGGIDSALTIALAVDALGADNVSAITMPSGFSSSGSVNDSVTLCQNLGVKLYTHPIKAEYDLLVEDFRKNIGVEPTQLAKENLQARIRANILMNFSNSTGALLLTTGNKSEISTGYFTIYGDSCGGLNGIGDLYKTEVFELCRWYNTFHKKELIPNVIIDKAPSAELSDNQKDSDSLPEYEVLDTILRVYLEGDLLTEKEFQYLLPKFNAIDKAVKQKVLNLLKKSEFKRKQSAPIIRVHKRAFGMGRQFPIAAKIRVHKRAFGMGRKFPIAAK